MKICEWLNIVNLFKICNSDLLNDSFLLLEFVLKKDRGWILVFDDYNLTFFQLNYLNCLFTRRLRGEPIFYLTNKCFFWKLSYKIYFDVFIPRSDTENMVEYVVNLVHDQCLSILDLGTGSGAIALSLANDCVNSFIIGVDINLVAIDLAKYNSDLLKLKNVVFFYSNWFSDLYKYYNYFDVIVGNPPYISKDDSCLLESNDLRFESYNSLVSSFEGLSDVYYIIENSYFYLKRNGFLILEHNFIHSNIIKEIYKRFCYFNIFTYVKNFYCFTIGQKKY